jgi:quinol monooxygenase YgiN
MEKNMKTDNNTKPVLVKFELIAKLENIESLKTFFETILPGTKNYDGNLGADYYVSQESPERTLLIEKWRSNHDFDSYINWRKEIGDFETLLSLVAEEPKLSFYTES